MKISICIGSSCHVKGSRQVVELMRELVDKNNLSDKIDLAGTFCMGKCQDGVCVAIEDKVFSVTPETVTGFFDNTVLPSLND